MANDKTPPEQEQTAPLDSTKEIPPLPGVSGEAAEGLSSIPTDVPVIHQQEDEDDAREEPSRPLFSNDLRKEYKPRKRRKPLLTLLAVVLVVAAIGALVFVATRYKPTEEFAPSKASTLTNYLTEDIESISIEIRDGDAYTVEYDAATSAYRLAGEDGSVLYLQSAMRDVYSSGLNIIASQTIAEEPEDLAMYGLDQPAAVVSLHHVNGQTFRYLLGNATPTGDGWYLKEEEHPAVYLVNETTGKRFSRAKADMRDLDILPDVQVSYANYVRLERPGQPTLELEQVLDGNTAYGWIFTQPQGVQVDVDALTQLCEDIAALEIRAYAATSADYAAYGLAEPEATVEIRDSEGGQLFFHIGGTSSIGESYFRLEGSDDIYITNNRFIAYRNTASIVSLASKTVANVLLNDVDSVRLSFSGKEHTLSISRPQGASAEYRIDGRDIESAAFQEFYQTLTSPQIHGEVSGAVEGDPVASFRFVRNGSRPEINVAFIPYLQDFYAVSLDGHDPVLYTRQEEVDAILVALDALMGE